MTPLVEARGIKKYFPVVKGVVLSRVAGWIKAVDDVSFSIGEGETFGLVGESGCGKTTIAKVILLLEQTTAGGLLFRGNQCMNSGEGSCVSTALPCKRSSRIQPAP